MRQSLVLVETLKQALKSHGLKYRDVANALGLSETSVKRLFSSGHLSLDRLEAICELMEIGFVDLVRMMEERRQRIAHLTEAQEQELVANIKLLLVAMCARNHLTFEEIVGNYAISEPECVQLLARLDRLQLIELLPNNRIRLIMAQDFRWIPNGPVERFFEQRVKLEFLDAAFDRDDELRLFLSGPLSTVSVDILLKRLEAVACEFQSLLKEDSTLPIRRRKSTGLGLTLRSWELSAFTALRRGGSVAR